MTSGKLRKFKCYLIYFCNYLNGVIYFLDIGFSRFLSHSGSPDLTLSYVGPDGAWSRGLVPDVLQTGRSDGAQNGYLNNL